jgi:hypothetical protein
LGYRIDNTKIAKLERKRRVSRWVVGVHYYVGAGQKASFRGVNPGWSGGAFQCDKPHSTLQGYRDRFEGGFRAQMTGRRALIAWLYVLRGHKCHDLPVDEWSRMHNAASVTGHHNADNQDTCRTRRWTGPLQSQPAQLCRRPSSSDTRSWARNWREQLAGLDASRQWADACRRRGLVIGSTRRCADPCRPIDQGNEYWASSGYERQTCRY